MNDFFDQGTAARVGKLKGIEGIFFGSFFDDGMDVRVFLKLMNIESGIMVRKAELRLPKSSANRDCYIKVYSICGRRS